LLAFFVTMTLLGCGAASSHELAENRATLVLRDQHHLALTLYVRYTESLHRALAPGKSYQEFLLAHAAMSPTEFERQLARGQTALTAGTAVLINGDAAPIEGWSWPAPARVQALLRQQVMEAMVGNGAHIHEPVLEVRADIRHAKAIRNASVRFAPEFGKVMLVAYRPTQVLLDERQASPPIAF
jgi:hypothetical protein